MPSQSKTLPRQLQLGHCTTGIQITGWIYSRQGDIIYQKIDTVWQAYKPVLKLQGRESRKLFVRISDEITRDPHSQGIVKHLEKLK